MHNRLGFALRSFRKANRRDANCLIASVRACQTALIRTTSGDKPVSEVSHLASVLASPPGLQLSVSSTGGAFVDGLSPRCPRREERLEELTPTDEDLVSRLTSALGPSPSVEGSPWAFAGAATLDATADTSSCIASQGASSRDTGLDTTPASSLFSFGGVSAAFPGPRRRRPHRRARARLHAEEFRAAVAAEAQACAFEDGSGPTSFAHAVLSNVLHCTDTDGCVSTVSDHWRDALNTSKVYLGHAEQVRDATMSQRACASIAETYEHASDTARLVMNALDAFCSQVEILSVNDYAGISDASEALVRIVQRTRSELAGFEPPTRLSLSYQGIQDFFESTQFGVRGAVEELRSLSNGGPIASDEVDAVTTAKYELQHIQARVRELCDVFAYEDAGGTWRSPPAQALAFLPAKATAAAATPKEPGAVGECASKDEISDADVAISQERLRSTIVSVFDCWDPSLYDSLTVTRMRSELQARLGCSNALLERELAQIRAVMMQRFTEIYTSAASTEHRGTKRSR